MSILSNNLTASDKLYISKDEFGNLVYSDKPPVNTSYRSQEAEEIKTIDWKQTTLSKSKKTKKKRSKKPRAKRTKVKLSRCSTLKTEIRDYEEKLAHRIEAGEFDSIKKKLSDVRWKYQTKC